MNIFIIYYYLPQLNPSHPHHSMNIPRMAVVGEPIGSDSVPWSYLPRRGPTILEAKKAVIKSANIRQHCRTKKLKSNGWMKINENIPMTHLKLPRINELHRSQRCRSPPTYRGSLFPPKSNLLGCSRPPCLPRWITHMLRSWTW